jgi:polyferredoxin
MRAGPLARLSRAALGEARAFVRLDSEPGTEVLKGPALRERKRRIEWSRHIVQAGFLLAVLLVGWDFVRWVHGLERGVVVGERPPGVEGFLPIAALLSLRHLVQAGEVHPVHPAGLVILALVLGMGLLAKKAFCSWVCPIGTLSEMLGALSRRVFRLKLGLPRVLDLPLRSLKYLLLAFLVYAVFFQMDARAVADFLDSPYNRVADVKMLFFFERLSPFALKVIAGLVALSFVVPYFWCRYLCPYGALLGAVSLLSPLKVTRHAPS